MNHHAFRYSLKVWLTTSLVVPLLITLLRFIRLHKYLVSVHCEYHCADAQYHKFIVRQSGMAIFSLITLIPLGVALYFTIIFLDKRQVPLYIYKRYLSVIGILFAVLPEVLLLCYSIAINIRSFYDLRTFSIDSIFYAIAVVASIWFYKLRPNVGLDLQSHYKYMRI
ncbi:MAG: hypothetical protein JWQ66_3825 [Mucilaginibacter sp.]|nr:hypothetical protein [Mucilaginibacter sp.]